jgi:formylglycine-generating enzyme required for sulfatase activity
MKSESSAGVASRKGVAPNGGVRRAESEGAAMRRGLRVLTGMVVALLVVPGVQAQVTDSAVTARHPTDGSKKGEITYTPAGAPAGGDAGAAAFSASIAAAPVTRPVRRRLRRSEAPSGELTVMLPGNVPLVLMRIPAGTFTMGSPDTERGHYSYESPQHLVTIGQDFYLGKYEVTQAQWQAVMGTAMPWSCGTYGMGPDYSVYCVSWNDIAGSGGFIEKLNQQQATAKFRLPTEAEWEYAARAGRTTEFSFSVPANWEKYCGTFAEAALYMWWCGNNAVYTGKPVGQKLPNPWGLYDMHGNLWEWVQDWWHFTYDGAPTDGSAWEVPAGSSRGLRGGHWNSYAIDCRSAKRDYASPDFLHNAFGFRLASSQ